jgi:hypothetical protein
MKKEEPDVLGDAVVDYIHVLEGKKPAAVAQIGGEQELTNEQRARLPYVLAAQQHCILCGEDPDVIGNWKIPDFLMKGRSRQIITGEPGFILFALCIRCKYIPGALQEVAKELISRVEGTKDRGSLLLT